MRARTTLQDNQTPRLLHLLNRGHSALQRFGIGMSPLAAADLIAAARRQSGLHEFGEDDFFEGLSRLLESCERDAGLNLMGRIALRADTLHCLRSRLLLERDRHKFPEIARQEIRAPVFIVGLPRTGTTILHTLLVTDPAHRAPLTWEVMQPSSPGDVHNRRSIRRAARSLACLRWLAPEFPRLHAVGAELPQECVSLMSLSFMSDQFDTMYNVPSYRAWFLRQNLAPAYEWHRKFLQHLQFGREKCRWILKAPAHMFSLPQLLSVYPDARFVQTHRAPLNAITSVSSLITILRRIFSDEVNPVDIGREAMRYWAETLETFMAQRDQLNADRVCDLPYQDIRRDPIAAVQRVYDHFGWSLSASVEERMRLVLATQPRDQVSFHRYHPAQFGLAADEMTGLFARYCDRFDLPIQEATNFEPTPATATESFTAEEDFVISRRENRAVPMMPPEAFSAER
jgi:hypothetical protein